MQAPITLKFEVPNKYRYLILKVVDEVNVELEHQDNDLKTLEPNLEQNLPRFIAVYVDKVDEHSVPKITYTKLYFVIWVPEGTSAKEKMLYPLVSKVVKSKFNGIHKEIHASEYHEIFEKI